MWDRPLLLVWVLWHHVNHKRRVIVNQKRKWFSIFMNEHLPWQWGQILAQWPHQSHAVFWKETWTSLTLASFPATVTKSNHSNREGSSNSPGGEENISAGEDASVPTPVDFSQSDLPGRGWNTTGGKRGDNVGGWDTRGQAHRSRLRCLNLWHGHLNGFTFSPGNKVVGKLVGSPSKDQRLAASQPEASLSTAHNGAD